MSSLRRSSGAALLCASALAGCSTVAPPEAVTSFARQDCASAPDLSRATGLTPEKEKVEHVVTSPVGADAACVRSGGSARPYVLYAMPAEADDKTLTVGAVLEPRRLLAPEVSLLGRGGEVTRTFAPHEYLFRGQVYSVQFRPRPGDAYVLVTVDPARVGQRYDSIAIGTNSTAVYAAGVTAMVTTGVDNAQSRTFSYEGAVQVTVNDTDVPKRR
jgi:hypothetical protein